MNTGTSAYIKDYNNGRNRIFIYSSGPVFSPIGQEYLFLQVSEIFLSRSTVSA